MPQKVTDPAILAQLNAAPAKSGGLKPVFDQAVLAQLNGEQPSLWDRIVASPVGRLAHDAVVQPLVNVGSQAAHFLPYMVAAATGNDIGMEAPRMVSEAADAPYQRSLERNRNTPGYQAAKAEAARVRSRAPESGFQDQMLAPIMPAMAGTMGGILGGSWDAANASADLQQEQQNAYAARNPVRALTGNVLGGALISPGRGITVPAKASAAETATGKAATYVKSLVDKSKLPRIQTDKPITAAEAIGKPAEVALGALARREGNTADALAAQLFERGQAAPERMMDDFAQVGGIPPEAARGDIDGLVKAGKARATPLYEDSFAGGSIAPLKDQLGNLVTRATSEKAVIAREIKKIERENAGALASRGAAGKGIRDRYMALQEELKAAEADRQAALGMFQKAQADIENNTPGAVWSPRVQTFLDDPIMRQGINKGLEVQRLEALAKGRRFDPTEYGVTGTDEAGNAIIGAVPNMRLLDAGKRGLDEIIEEARDSVTRRVKWTPRLKAVDDVRRSYVTELDNLNPRYKAAREAAGDYLSAQEAFDSGGKMLLNPNMTEKQFAEYIGKLTGTNKDAFKGGVANRIFDMAQTGKLDPKKFATPRVREKLRTIFGKEGADKLLANLSTEARMGEFARKRAPGNGSPTAELLEAMRQQDGDPGAAMDLVNFANDTVKQGARSAVVNFGANKLKNAGARWATRGMSLPVRDEAGRLLMLPQKELDAELARLLPRRPGRGATRLPASAPYGLLGSAYGAVANQ